jgi:hypothetical protein
MSRFRLRVGCCLAVVAISLVVLGVPHFAPVAAAAQPRISAQAFAQAMHVQNRHTERLMVVPGVAGTATGLDAAGQPVVKVFLERHGIGGIPIRLEGVPVAIEVTGGFYALRQPAKPGGAKNRAPSVVIYSPADGDRYASGEPILFWGRASDREDGNLSESIEWSSDINGEIGTGAYFSDTLDDGEHTITARVTDTGGKIAVGSVTITVGGVDPTAWFTRPVPIGVSTGHPDITAGTIGCRVKDAEGNVYALSNNHIYADCNRATIGDSALQPGPYDGGTDPDDMIGTLLDFHPIVFSRRASNTIDAAVAQSSTAWLGNATPTDGYGTPNSITAQAVVDLKVMKYGRTTGLTYGQVYAVNATVNVSYGNAGVARFVGQIVVTPGTFSAGGDSGSLVVTQMGNSPVGLLFAGSTSYTICNPIDVVLERFHVTVDDAK